MALVGSFRNYDDPRFYKVELHFSAFHWVSGHRAWYCRLWRPDWLDATHVFPFGDGWGRTKFEAYRRALGNYQWVTKKWI